MRSRFSALAVLTLMLTACAGAIPATPTPTGTPTPTPTPTPTATPQPTPAAVLSAEPAPRVEMVMTASATGSGVKFVYEPEAVTVGSGTFTLVLKNEPGAQQELPPAHNLVLGGEPPKLTNTGWELSPAITSSSLVGPNKTDVLTVEGLSPGSYSFWCTVSGHFTSGMMGTLTVTR